MLRLILTAIMLSGLAGCVSEGQYASSSRATSPQIAPALDGTDLNAVRRSITVYLVADDNVGYVRRYRDRVVMAEPVYSETLQQAKAKLLVQGVNTIVFGNSCAELRQRYDALTSCEVSETVSLSYGPVETTATSDREGFATLSLGHGAYRIVVQSWPTHEDANCNWGGSILIPAIETAIETAHEQLQSVELKVLVYCE